MTTYEDKLQDMALAIAMCEVIKELTWQNVIVEFVEMEEIAKAAKALLAKEPELVDQARAELRKGRRVS